MDEQELNRKFQMLEQKIRQTQEQLEAVERAIFDMSTINVGIEELKGKTGEEIMAPIGRGIFVKANLVSENIIVDVGSGNFIEKTIDETKDMISGQKEKMKGFKEELEKELDLINQDITKTMQEYQSSQPQ